MIPTIADASEARSGTSSGTDQNTGVRGEAPQAGTGPVQRQPEALPPSIEAFDAMIEGVVKTYVNVSEEIGGLVAEQV